MKTIKFRLEHYNNAKPTKRYKLQTKVLGMWRYENNLVGIVNPLTFSSESEAIEYLYNEQVEKPEHLKLIQYPTITILQIEK